MQYYIIKLTRINLPEWPRAAKVGDTWYHTGGRGNGAFANMYEKPQVNRILGQYKNSKEIVAEAIEVFINDNNGQ